MKVHPNRTHGLRHDRLSVESERGAIAVSLMAHHNDIIVDVTIDGVRHEGWVSARRLAEILASASNQHGEIS